MPKCHLKWILNLAASFKALIIMVICRLMKDLMLVRAITAVILMDTIGNIRIENHKTNMLTLMEMKVTKCNLNLICKIVHTIK